MKIEKQIKFALSVDKKELEIFRDALSDYILHCITEGLKNLEIEAMDLQALINGALNA